MVGARAVELIALSACSDPFFESAALAAMAPVARSDEVHSETYASLDDTVHTLQRYGMVGPCQPAKPLEDPAHVDERRTALDIPPMSSGVSTTTALTGSLVTRVE